MKDKKSIIIIISIGIIFTVFWFVFYPPIYAIHDEAGYMAQAYVMRKGTIFGDVAGIPVVSSIETSSGHLVTKYAPGMSFLLIPFTLFGWKTIFLMPLILHILGFFVFIQMLRLLKISDYFSLFYLLYPTSVLYSRTIMADIPSAVFFIIAVYFFLRRKHYCFFSGFFLGILPLFRYSNVILTIPFFILAIVELIKSIRKSSFLQSSFLKILLGFLPGFFLLIFYNKVAFGGFLKTPLGVTGTFSLQFLPRNLIFYILSLSLIYPFMFFSIFFVKKFRLLLISAAFLFLLFYSSYYYYTLAPGNNLSKTLVVGMRFLLPIIPIFLIGYVQVFENIRKRFSLFAMGFFWFLVACFSFLDLGMVFQHQGFLKEQEKYKNTIYENTDDTSLIVTNYEGLEFFQPAWGKRECTLFAYWKRKIPVNFEKYDFDKLYLLTVIRSDKEGNEYVRQYAKEIVEEYDGVLITEIKRDPELRLWRLNYESNDDSETENRGIGVSEKAYGKLKVKSEKL